MKDPVVMHNAAGLWHLWASVHPLDIAGAEDRMTTEHYTSPDGIAWTHQGRALDTRPGLLDSRGVRVTAVVAAGGRVEAWYDGRASAAEYWEERLGLALGTDLTRFVSSGQESVAQSPYPPGGLRYLSVVPLAADGGQRLYYEGTRSDGAHELRTQLV